MGASYSKEHETILRKYDHFPNMFKNLYKNAEVKIVTDSKGNTWYEVDVPKDYLTSEWRYKQGGILKAQGGLSLLKKVYGLVNKLGKAKTIGKIGEVSKKVLDSEKLGGEASYVKPFLEGTKPIYAAVAEGHGHVPEQFKYIDDLLKGTKYYDYTRPWFNGETQTLRYYINENKLK